MMDLSSAVQWWDEWQLRILVLGSLGLQWFLLVAAPMRKFAIPLWFRRCIWLAYLTSDALAIYALATLFNRHAKATTTTDSGRSGSTASVLEVLWAPVLLIHLGGQEEMTAYNIEDNELWRRHAITLVSQVTVALYAFCKSWPSSGEKRLLAAAILLFIVGVLSFCEKPWALKRASFNSLVAVSSQLTATRKSPEGFVSRCREFCFADLREEEGTTTILSQREKIQMILADMSLSAADYDGVRVPQLVTPSLHGRPHPELSSFLRGAFAHLYTRANVVLTPAYMALHLLLTSLHSVVIMLFARSHKHGYDGADVKVTYILLCCTAALDFVALLIRLYLFELMSKAGVPPLCEKVAGHNLIEEVLKRRPPIDWLMRCAVRIGCKDDHVNEHGNAQDIVGVVLAHLLAAGTENVRELDVASYRRFSDREGDNWALRAELQNKVRDGEIQRSLEVPFDKSVLLWHVATDLCFRCCPAPAEYPITFLRYRIECTQAISNYMAYLLYVRPEMLMTGTRQRLFYEACNEAADLILKNAKQPLDPTILEKRIIPEAAALKDKAYHIIPDACRLAQALMRLQDDMWKVMEGVLVGMLCYSASMCRGYLHAKSLGEGGEFLSLIWVLLSLKGVKTLADKLQMPEPAQTWDVEDPQVPEPEEQAQEELGMPAAAGASTTSQHQA